MTPDPGHERETNGKYTTSPVIRNVTMKTPWLRLDSKEEYNAENAMAREERTETQTVDGTCPVQNTEECRPVRGCP